MRVSHIMRKSAGGPILGLALTLALVLASVSPTSALPSVATSITVDTTVDRVDGDASSFDALLANKGADGLVSLREAVLALKGQTAPSWINLTPGTYLLESPATTVSVSPVAPDVMGGALGIAGSVTIAGAGSTIRPAAAATDRIFDIDPAAAGGVFFEADDVLLTAGGVAGPVGGGALRAGGTTDTVAHDAVVLRRCTLAGNSATGAVASSGGALNIGRNLGLTIDACTFTGNRAKGVGGAVFVADSGTGSLVVTDSVFTTNVSDGSDVTAGQGGAIYARVGAASTISHSTFTSNTVTSANLAGPDRGGALFIGGPITVRDCRIVGNVADDAAGAFGFLVPADAAYNWWGTNTNPTTSTPVTQAGGDLVTSPWLQFKLAPAPQTIYKGQSSDLTARLGDATHRPPTGSLPATFAGVLGSIAPTSRVLVSDVATAAFTAGSVCGPATQTAYFDGVAASAVVSITGEPAILAAAATTFTVGSSGLFAVSASGYPVPRIGVTGSLPAGLSFNYTGSTGVTAGAGRVSGTPAADTGGRYSVTLVATNGVSPDATAPLTITVVQAPAFAAPYETTVTVGTLVSFDVTTTGFPVAAISAQGPLPAGLALTDDGDGTVRITGTPSGDGGTFAVTLRANNGVSAPVDRTYTLHVQRAPAIPASREVTFTVGVADTMTIPANGYPAPGIQILGALPGGLGFAFGGSTGPTTSAGALAGTPAPGTGGRYPVSVTASNGIAPADTEPLLVTVVEAPAFLPPLETTFTVGTLASFDVSTTGFPAAAITALDPLPAGLALADNGNGAARITGTAAKGTGGVYPVRLQADNGVSAPVSRVVTITVFQPRPDWAFRRFMWDFQADFEHNANTTGATTTIGGGVRTDTRPGYVVLGSVTGLAAGTFHTVGLRSDGTVIAIGLNDDGECNVGQWTTVTGVGAGAYHTVGLRSDGTVAAVGKNTYGQRNVSTWTSMTAVAAGGYHTLGLRSDGTVVATGFNADGQCNVSTWTAVTAISAGEIHTVGLRTDGTVVATGSNTSGQCNVSTWTGVRAVAAGDYHTVGLRSDGTVVATGSNLYGQCNVSTWTSITAVSAGMFHTVGIRSDGTVVSTGSNSWGQCNVSTWTNITAVAAGGFHTVGLRSDGTVVVAGDNGFGQSAVGGFYPGGTIGGAGTAVGLRAVADAVGFTGWESIVSSTSPLASGQAVKYGVRLSSDGVVWSEVLGRNGLPIDWTTGSGNYLGVVAGQPRRTDLSGLPHARYIDVVVRLESSSGPELALDGVSVTYARDDAVPPTVTDDAPSGWVRDAVTVTVTATDAVSGVAATAVSVAGPGSPAAVLTTESAVVPVTGEGTTTIDYSAVDGAGNRCATQTATVRLDRTAPGLAVIGSPTAVSIDASDAVSGVASVWYIVDAGAPQLYAGVPFSPGLSGVHTVTAWALDVAGNIAVGTRIVTVDTAPPVVTNDAPAGWRTSDVTVTVSAHDDFSGVAGIDLAVGGAGGPLQTSVASAVAVVPVTAEGTTTIGYAAFDGAGNRSATDTAIVRIDKTTPSTTATFAAGWRRGPVTVTLTGADAVSGIDSTWYRTTPAGGWIRYTGPFDITAEGTTTVAFWSADVAGNSEGVRTADIRVDDSAPGVLLDAPAGWRNADVTVKASASDALSGLGLLRVVVAGPSGTAGFDAAGASWQGVIADEGTTTVVAFALDKVGNLSAEVTGTVLLDKTAPSTAASHTAGWANGPVTVELTAADALSGVTGTWYRIGAGGATPYGGPFAVSDSGETTVTFWSADRAGNTEGEKTTVVRIDTAPPVVSDDAPHGWSTADVRVHLSAVDALSGVAGIDWTLAGPAGSASGSAPGRRADIDVSAEGTTTIDYSASDRAGLRSAPGKAIVRLDKTKPSTTASHAVGWSAVPVAVTLRAADAISGVSATWYRIGSGGPTLYGGPFTLAASGRTAVSFWSVDAAGNVEGVKSTVVSFDGVAPVTVSDARQTYLTGGGSSIRLSASDSLSGVAWTRWSLDGSASVVGTVVPVPVPAGSHVLTYCSADTAGNVEATRQATFDVVAKSVTRLGGYDRYDVAALVARTGWDPAAGGTWPGVKHVIVACGERGTEADPLSAAGLAGVYDAPIFLTRRLSVPNQTIEAIAEIAAANPGVRVHIVGGTGSVPDARFAQLRRIPGVDPVSDRLGGIDRYAVSAAVARRMVSVAGTASIGGALLVCAEKPAAFFDALAVSPIAFARHMPMLGVRTGSVPPVMAPVLASLRGAGKPVYAASGPAWIGPVVAAGASRLTTSADMYRAAADIAATATAAGWLSNSEPGLASKLPDSLTGGTFLGRRGGVLLFTDTSAVMRPASAAYLTAHRSEVARGWIFGGTGSVQASVHTQFRNLIQ